MSSTDNNTAVYAAIPALVWSSAVYLVQSLGIYKMYVYPEHLVLQSVHVLILASCLQLPTLLFPSPRTYITVPASKPDPACYYNPTCQRPRTRTIRLPRLDLPPDLPQVPTVLSILRLFRR